MAVEMKEAVVVADFFDQIQFSPFAKQLLFGVKGEWYQITVKIVLTPYYIVAAKFELIWNYSCWNMSNYWFSIFMSIFRKTQNINEGNRN